eukprot:16438066-Heterocapsa_arctica.AAC.1
MRAQARSGKASSGTRSRASTHATQGSRRHARISARLSVPGSSEVKDKSGLETVLPALDAGQSSEFGKRKFGKANRATTRAS